MAQVQVTPELTLLAGIRHRDSEQGDITEDFDPDDFSATERRDITETIPRAGFRYSAVPSSTLIGTIAYNERDEDVDDDDEFFPVKASSEVRGVNGEVQHIFEQDRFNVTFGAGLYDAEREDSLMVSDLFFPDFPIVLVDNEEKTEVNQYNLYGYSAFAVTENISIEGGLSFDNFFVRDSVDEERVNPKLGAIVEPIEGLRFRAAALRSLKRDLSLDQTIEPTTVAGFNQFFDYANGSRVDLVGGGVEYELSSRATVGAVATVAQVDEPRIDLDEVETFKIDDNTFGGYLHLVPTDQLALSIAPSFSHIETKPIGDDLDVPDDVETFSVPTRLSFFSPTGFFAHVSANYINQDVSRSAGAFKATGTDDEIFLGAGVGYRLPQRRGIVSFEVKNLLDREMQFQDLNFINARIADSGIEQDRMMLVRGTVQF